MRGGLMRYVMIGCCLAVASLIASPAEAQVHVDIGINLPGPPALVVVPGTPVYYAPRAPANVFFYAHQYWVFGDAGWYVGPTWSGPWAVVEPGYVPAPILGVPVQYYPAPPGHTGEHGVVMDHPTGRHATDATGAKNPTSVTGVNARSTGAGAREGAAARTRQARTLLARGCNRRVICPNDRIPADEPIDRQVRSSARLLCEMEEGGRGLALATAPLRSRR